MPEFIERLEEVSDKLRDQVLIDPIMFAGIIDALPDGLLVINDQGIIQLVNQQIELLFGYPRTQLVGSAVHMLLGPELNDIHVKHIAEYFSHPTVRPMNMAKQLPGRHRSGRTITVQISLGPVVSTQGVLGLALVRRVHGN
jgi:eukaryotic-like serine/threonine-protein kinase